jgi:hypothetical protein
MLTLQNKIREYPARSTTFTCLFLPRATKKRGLGPHPF